MSKALEQITFVRRLHGRFNLQIELLFLNVINQLKVTLIGS